MKGEKWREGNGQKRDKNQCTRNVERQKGIQRKRETWRIEDQVRRQERQGKMSFNVFNTVHNNKTVIFSTKRSKEQPNNKFWKDAQNFNFSTQGLPFTVSSGLVYTVAFLRYLGTRSLPSHGPWIGKTEKFHSHSFYMIICFWFYGVLLWPSRSWSDWCESEIDEWNIKM